MNRLKALDEKYGLHSVWGSVTGAGRFRCSLDFAHGRCPSEDL